MKLAVAFKDMQSKGYFCICDVEKAASLLGVAFTREQRQFLGLLHCVKFADMPEEVKGEIQSILEDVFSSEAFVGKTILGKPKIKRLRLA